MLEHCLDINKISRAPRVSRDARIRDTFGHTEDLLSYDIDLCSSFTAPHVRHDCVSLCKMWTGGFWRPDCLYRFL